ncbi:hypothetical protein P152DRAFT_460928 [Eremomyces bilateralis CBS 781.70]|uniref:Uncharacterized protein n=1 Tax=Eremomyces bilateralis CBS 781.70 TaxID=1392243 RepID=A0A6G1FWI3_9PEZI|nr:uncharacterized protein P152DRAFT_460928 [Eremomyces bilateralis CBS 781.70]KAF1810134.1 hypothetical protein P152DRAFT_460928 [Eremomyces bilateralis CBS 781.70]
MGGRLSMPRSPDKANEISRPVSGSRRGFPLNSRTIVAPLAAFTMAGLLFFYARVSIRAAKLNAAKTREADGGEVNWRKVHMRNHGQIEEVEKPSVKEAIIDDPLFGTKRKRKADDATRDGSA